jgi:hypothetical protein
VVNKEELSVGKRIRENEPVQDLQLEQTLFHELRRYADLDDPRLRFTSTSEVDVHFSKQLFQFYPNMACQVYYFNPNGGCWLKTGNLPVKKTGKWNFTGIIYRFLP